jgi:hypothetical protein
MLRYTITLPYDQTNRNYLFWKNILDLSIKILMMIFIAYSIEYTSNWDTSPIAQNIVSGLSTCEDIIDVFPDDAMEKT